MKDLASKSKLSQLSLSEEIIFLPRVTLFSVGATFDPQMSFEQWAAGGKSMTRLAEGVQWWIGDWMNFGETAYVESRDGQRSSHAEVRRKYEVALESLPYEYGSIRNFKWVCKAIPLSLRSDKLSFRHHQEVAGKTEKRRAYYLRIAEEKNFSVADLREFIRRSEAEVDDETGPAPAPSPNHWTNQLSMWLGQQEPEKWPRERLEIVQEELSPIAEFHARVRKLLSLDGQGKRVNLARSDLK